MFLSKITGECWDSVLVSVGNLDSKFLIKNKAQQCPNCGGHDRYEYLGVNKYSKLYDGSYLCRGCGAGDGFSLLIKLTSLKFNEVRDKVMDYLGLEKPGKTFVDFNSLTVDEISNNLVYKDVNQHPYMIAKKLNTEKLGIKDIGLYKGRLAIPLYKKDGDSRRLVTYELISTDGKKLSLKGIPRKDCFYSVGNKINKRVYICEGFSTALSLHLLTDEVCIASFGAMNFHNVFRQVLLSFRHKGFVPRIVLACDHDPAGMKLCDELNAFCLDHDIPNVSCIYPRIRNTDFSDLYVEYHKEKIENLLDDITIFFNFK